MLSEQVTVTTTPTSIRNLIRLARSIDLADIAVLPSRCEGIMLRYGKAESAVVSLTDADSGARTGSVNGAVILDAFNEDLLATSFSQFSIDQSLLSCDTGTVVVHVIVNQEL